MTTIKTNTAIAHGTSNGYNTDVYLAPEKVTDSINKEVYTAKKELMAVLDTSTISTIEYSRFYGHGEHYGKRCFYVKRNTAY